MRLTKQDLVTTLDYLRRVIPRGQAESDELFRLISVYEHQLKQARKPSVR